MREVVYIFEREGLRGGPYWRLVLECGHSVAASATTRGASQRSRCSGLSATMLAPEATCRPLLRIGMRAAGPGGPHQAVRGRQGAVRCGVCHAPLKVRGYRSVAVASGTRRVPLDQPCTDLDDPERHPACETCKRGSL